MRRGLIFLTAMLLVLLAACGSGDDDDGVGAAVDDAASSGLASADDGGDAATSGLVDEGDGDNGGSGDPPDPCDLLTVDDLIAEGIAAASGPVPTEGARFPECRFAGAAGEFVLQVQVFAPEDTGGAVGDQVDVDGLGEAAVYSAGNRTLVIDLSDGSQIILYSPFDAEPADPRDTLIALGRIAAG